MKRLVLISLMLLLRCNDFERGWMYQSYHQSPQFSFQSKPCHLELDAEIYPIIDIFNS